MLTLYFFRGRGMFGAIERAGLAPAFVPCSTVPGHVSLSYGNLYAEAVWPRVVVTLYEDQPVHINDLLQTVRLPVPAIRHWPLAEFVLARAGDRYSVRAVVLDAIDRLLPREPARCWALAPNEWTCSMLALAACKSAGYEPKLPDGEVDHPWTPLDLLVWSRARAQTVGGTIQ